jgi:hypothetical protein
MEKGEWERWDGATVRRWGQARGSRGRLKGTKDRRPEAEDHGTMYSGMMGLGRKTTPMAWGNVSSPALTKPMVIRVVALED